MEQQRDDKGVGGSETAAVRRTDGSSGGGLSFSAFLFFILFAVAAATLFITAAVLWLAGIVGSVALSSLIFGGVAAIIALIVYLVPVRRSARILHDYLETVYETSRIAKSGYERIKSWVEFLFD